MSSTTLQTFDLEALNSRSSTECQSNHIADFKSAYISLFSLLANGRKLMAWPGVVFLVVVVVVGVVNNFFSSLFSSETTAPISLKFGMELPWVEDYHFSPLHVFPPIRKVT